MADIATAIAEVRQAAFEHRFEEAASHARDILLNHPSCLVALRALAWAQLSLGDDDALETFQTCATLDPEDALAHVGQAIWFERHSLRERSLSKFLHAWELQPYDQRVRKEVVRLGGDLPESPLAEGIGLVQEGRCDAATGPLRQAAAENPHEMAAPLALATALWRLGGKQQAYNLATTVLATRPQCVKALLFVIAVEAASGRTLRTRELVARGEQVDPGFELYGDLVQELQIAPVIERFQSSRASLVGR